MSLFNVAPPQRLTLRFVAVGLLVFALGIPLMLVDGVADERQGYYHEVVAGIAQSWGREQRLTGPLLALPVRRDVIRENDRGERHRVRIDDTHIVLPQELDIEVQIDHEFRQRSLYAVPVYHAEVMLKGSLDLRVRGDIDARYASVDWSRARLVLGVGDTRAIRHASVSVGDDSLTPIPGSTLDWLEAGIHVPLALADEKAPGSLPFLVSLRLGGTNSFALAPLGDQTVIDMASSWPHPSFTGDFLPESRDIDAQGFRARWSVSALARGLPNHFLSGEGRRLQWLQAGVNLHQPVTSYTTVDRGIKYGLLIIAMTFLTALCFELVSGIRFHLIQYGVVGLALVLFYMTLLSLSEHVEFVWAYTLASTVTICLLGWYAWNLTRSAVAALSFMGVELLLYAVLYVLLRMEDAALLSGTSLLLLGLVALMAVTRGLHEPRPVPAGG